MKQKNKWYFDRLFWFILLLGLIIRIAFIFYSPPVIFDAKDFDALGKSISKGYGYSIEGINNTPYIGIRAPGYPLFLGLVYSIFGYNHFVVYALQIMLDLLIILMLYLFMQKLFPDRIYSYIIALFWSLNLMSAYYSVSLLSETFYLFLFMLAIYLFFVKIYIERKFTYVLLLSLILGYASLVKSFLLYVYVLLLIAAIYLFFTRYDDNRDYSGIKKRTHTNIRSVINAKNIKYTKNGKTIKEYTKKKFFTILFLSIILFSSLYSAFMIRNYVLFDRPVAHLTLVFMDGNPNLLNSSDYAYLHPLILDEYKNFTPIGAIDNSKVVSSYVTNKIFENPLVFISNSFIRASLFWFEPFGVRSVFLVDGKENSFDKAYAPSVSFILNYGPLGFFKGLSFTLLIFVILIFLFWMLFLVISFYGLYLLFFKYKNRFLAISILLLCLYFTGIYALTVVVPRYFIQNMLLLSIPLTVGLTELFLKFIKFKSFKKTRLFLKSMFGVKNE